jgi:diamine N-acetyltransferase
MNAKFSIGAMRAMTASDIEDLSQVLPQMNPWATLGYSSTSFMRYFRRDDPALQRLSACVNGSLAGAICVRYPWLMGAYLEFIALFPEFQGKGIGSEILHLIEERARPHSNNLWTLVSSFNGDARRFYERNGFVAIVSIPALIKDGYDEVLMRKMIRK